MAGKPAARIQVTGAKELRAAMKAANADLKDWTAVHKRAAEPVQVTAQDIVPVLTGKLRGSIKVRATKTSARVIAGSGVVPYAGPIHFGWPAHNIAAQPFLWDAADVSTDDVTEIYNREVEGLVRKIDRMTPDR